MDEPKRLNKAELAGLAIATRHRDQSRQQYEAAEKALAELLGSVGLEPGINYQVSPEGVVTVPKLESVA